MGPSLVLTRIRYAEMAAIVIRLFSPPAGLEEVKDWLASGWCKAWLAKEVAGGWRS